jgi:hypothetical protein
MRTDADDFDIAFIIDLADDGDDFRGPYIEPDNQVFVSALGHLLSPHRCEQLAPVLLWIIDRSL